jgi:DNA-binding MarR family transcriptional regulator
MSYACIGVVVRCPSLERGIDAAGPGLVGAKRSPMTRRDDAYRAAAEFRLRLLAFQRRTEEVAARCGLTPERYLLLLLLRVAELDRRETTVTSLCEPLRMTQSSVSRLVGGAARAGLVERRGDMLDRRRQHLVLTPEGARRLERGFAELGPDRAALTRALRGSGFDPIA